MPVRSILSGVRSASISTFIRTVSFAEASHPSVSMEGSASRKPCSLPLRMISSMGTSLAISLRMKFVVAFRMPSILSISQNCRQWSAMLNVGVPAMTVVSKKKRQPFAFARSRSSL